MDEEYDYVILGTGIVECALCWALAQKGKKVIQIDEHTTYGSDLRTLNYIETQEYFGKEGNTEIQAKSQQFNIDLMPKVIIADGEVRLFLEKQGLFEVLEFANITGSFIYKNGKLHNVPTSHAEAITSGVVGLFQKGSVMSFFWNAQKYLKSTDPGKSDALPKTLREHFKQHGLNKESQEFIGHAIALNLDDGYLDLSPGETLERIGLFVRSLMAFKNSAKSPYIYPLYGTSELSQVFSRRAAIYGATFRLNSPVLKISCVNDKIEIQIEDRIEGGIAKISCKNVVGEPVYFKAQSRVVNKIIHCTCIIRGDVKLTKGCSSAQIIFLASQLKRKNDIFLLVLGEAEKAAPENFKIAMISTVLETNDALGEIQFIFELLGDIVEKHIKIRDVFEPVGMSPNMFITRTVDQSTHFESVFAEIIRMAELLDCAQIFK